MDRRGFLGAMLAACAAPAIVRAESLMLIRPIEIATLEQVWAISGAGNNFLTCQLIAREALRILNTKMIFSEAVNREYEDEKLGKPLGSTLIIPAYPGIKLAYDQR